jgi:hypothetical protein
MWGISLLLYPFWWLLSWLMYALSWAWFWIYYGFFFSAFFLLLGDFCLTFVVRKTALDFVAPSFRVSWLILMGSFSLEGLELSAKTLKLMNDFLPLPADLQTLALGRFSFQLPWISLLLGRSSFFSGVRIEGFSLDLSWQSVEKWGWRKEEHLERFERAIAEAGVTRIAQAKAWMDKVESNLEKINEWKKKNTTTATAAAKENEETKGAKKALATTTEQSKKEAPPAPQGPG